MRRGGLRGLALLLLASPAGRPRPHRRPRPRLRAACSTAPSAYAKAVVDWWIPACSLGPEHLQRPAEGARPEDAAGKRAGELHRLRQPRLRRAGDARPRGLHLRPPRAGPASLPGGLERAGLGLRVALADRSLHPDRGPQGVRRAGQLRPGLLRLRPRHGRRDAGPLREGRGRGALPLPGRHASARAPTSTPCRPSACRPGPSIDPAALSPGSASAAALPRLELAEIAPGGGVPGVGRERRASAAGSRARPSPLGGSRTRARSAARRRAARSRGRRGRASPPRAGSRPRARGSSPAAA